MKKEIVIQEYVKSYETNKWKAFIGICLGILAAIVCFIGVVTFIVALFSSIYDAILKGIS